MDDILGPSTVEVDVRGADFQWVDVVGDFLGEFGTLVGGGGEVYFKLEVAILAWLDPYRIQALLLCADVDVFDYVVIDDELWQGALCLDD